MDASSLNIWRFYSFYFRTFKNWFVCDFEGMFGAGMISSYLKLVHIFSINPYLGPLQVSHIHICEMILLNGNQTYIFSKEIIDTVPLNLLLECITM
jgi:hypothetical protein